MRGRHWAVYVQITSESQIYLQKGCLIYNRLHGHHKATVKKKFFADFPWINFIWIFKIIKKTVIIIEWIKWKNKFIKNKKLYFYFNRQMRRKIFINWLMINFIFDSFCVHLRFPLYFKFSILINHIQDSAEMLLKWFKDKILI